MVRVSYVMNVLNGEPFIKYQLKSIYAHAHEIIIVEGAYLKFAFATNNGRSQDSTLQSIKAFSDPENKIKLIVKDVFYYDRMEMCNEFMQYVTGDIIWQIDADEFYHDSTHFGIKILFNNDPELDVVSFNFIDLFGSLNLKIEGLEGTGLQEVRRVHRFSKGDIWINQRPPILGNKKGDPKPIRKIISGNEMKLNGHMMFNLTMLFEKQIKDKFLYYQSKDFTGPMYNWYEQSVKTFQNKFNMLNLPGHLTYLTFLNCRLPMICNEINQECLSVGTKYPFIDDQIHKRFLNKASYSYQVKVAIQINILPQHSLSLSALTLKVFQITVNIFSCFDISSQLFVLKVFWLKILLSYRKVLARWLRSISAIFIKKLYKI
jgi:hypothetical protein